MTTNQEIPSTEAQSVAIPKNEFPAIALKLNSFFCDFNFLRESLLKSQKGNHEALMSDAEAKTFESLLYQAHENTHEVFLQLSVSDDQRLQEIAANLMKCEKHSGFMLDYFNPSVEKKGKPVQGIDFRAVEDYRIESLMLLITEVCKIMACCVHDFNAISETKPGAFINQKNQLDEATKGSNELRDAANLADEIGCMFEFIDCANLVDLDGCNMHITRKQMDGVFSLLDTAVNNLEKIWGAVNEYGTLEQTKAAICESIEAALNIISLAVKIEKVRLSNEEEDEGKEDSNYSISLSSIFNSGFLASIRFVGEEHVQPLYTAINELREAITIRNEGGADAVDTLH